MLRPAIPAVLMVLLSLLQPLPASAGTEFPWSCRDADAVMASAHAFSRNTPILDWDESRIFQAMKEYAECFRDAVDGQDRFKSGQGTAYAMSLIAYREYLLAKSVNVLRGESIARRRGYFAEMQKRATRDYLAAADQAASSLSLANDEGVEDTGNFAGWARRNLTDRLREVQALRFSRLQTYAELMGHR